MIGWARSFSDPLTVSDITMMGGRSLERLTRIAGRDVRLTDGHTVGKTFVRKVLGSTRGGRFQPIGGERSIDKKIENTFKKGPLQKATRETGLGFVRPVSFVRRWRKDQCPAKPGSGRETQFYGLIIKTC